MKRFFKVLALVLSAALLLSACGAGTSPDSSSSQGSTSSADSSSEATGHDETSALESTEGSSVPADTSSEASETSESSSAAAASDSSEAAETSESSSEAETSEGETAQEVPVELTPMMYFGVAEPTELEEGDEADETEIQEIDRVMRDYSPVATLFVNKAKSYFYYNQLSESRQQIYDCILMACYDPSGSNYVAYLTNTYPGGTDFSNEVTYSYWAVLYDHPELFHQYVTRDLHWKYTTGKAPYTVYFYTDKYENYKEEVTEFNQAVTTFLSSINTKVSDEEIVRQIHDKLVDTVTYDHKLYYDKGLRYDDLGHSAYGALVRNQDGVANTAVCDGYSLAFVYLCQQLGINAIYNSGWGGSDTSNMGGHAWNMVELNGKWYELDVTWDDYANCLSDPTNASSQWLPYWTEIYNNSYCRDYCEHYLFLVSTATMRDYVSDPYATYTSMDGRWIFRLASNSVHRRDSEVSRWYIWDELNKYVPIAP